MTPRMLFDFISSIRNLDVKETTEKLRNYFDSFEAVEYYDKLIATLSRGNKQKMQVIASLIHDPDLLIADEATTALDVTIQAQILELLKELKSRMGTTLVIITHDLGIVAEQSDRILVMYAGNIIEEAETFDLFSEPKHPYTIGLLSAVPKLGTEKLAIIPGMTPPKSSIFSK